MGTVAAAPEVTTGRCTNGGCTKPLYRGTECFRCWSGTKWDSMKQRVENKRNRYPQWAGKTLDFSRREFIAWAASNPPPTDMESPSVDRIDSARGYAFDNIRWLDVRLNGRGTQRDIPLSHRRCARCSQVKLLAPDNFHRNKSNPLGFQSYCKGCRRGNYRVCA